MYSVVVSSISRVNFCNTLHLDSSVEMYLRGNTSLIRNADMQPMKCLPIREMYFKCILVKSDSVRYYLFPRKIQYPIQAKYFARQILSDVFHMSGPIVDQSQNF